MPSRKALIAATATLTATGAMVAMSIASTPSDNAGKAFASKPVVKTTVTTKTKTVHVKRKVKVARPAPVAVASQPSSATAGSASSTRFASNGPVTSPGEPAVQTGREWEDDSSGEDDRYEAREPEHEDREWEDEDERD